MRIRLIATEGRGGTAEIEADGQRLRVVDEWSKADAAASAGALEGATLEVVVNPRFTQGVPQADAPALVPEAGWRYRAYAEIVATEPARAAVGPLVFVLELPGAESWQPGDRVQLAIDRIVLRRPRR